MGEVEVKVSEEVPSNDQMDVNKDKDLNIEIVSITAIENPVQTSEDVINENDEKTDDSKVTESIDVPKVTESIDVSKVTESIDVPKKKKKNKKKKKKKKRKRGRGTEKKKKKKKKKK